MIQVHNLTKFFGPILAVDRVSFEVTQGEIVGFLGPNGAGKTTTMRILTSYLPATSGIAKVNGYDVMMQSMEVRRSIGYLPESVPSSRRRTSRIRQRSRQYSTRAGRSLRPRPLSLAR